MLGLAHRRAPPRAAADPRKVHRADCERAAEASGRCRPGGAAGALGNVVLSAHVGNPPAQRGGWAASGSRRQVRRWVPPARVRWCGQLRGRRGVGRSAGVGSAEVLAAAGARALRERVLHGAQPPGQASAEDAEGVRCRAWLGAACGVCGSGGWWGRRRPARPEGAGRWTSEVRAGGACSGRRRWWHALTRTPSRRGDALRMAGAPEPCLWGTFPQEDFAPNFGTRAAGACGEGLLGLQPPLGTGGAPYCRSRGAGWLGRQSGDLRSRVLSSSSY